MSRKVTERDIERYLLIKKRIHPHNLFSERTSKDIRELIVGDVMTHFTGFKMTRWGLALKKNPRAYHYKGYKDYRHIKDVKQLVFDVNHTNKLKKSYAHQIERKVFLLKEKKRKERELKRKSKENLKEHKKKWSIDPNRAEKLASLRDKQITRDKQR